LYWAPLTFVKDPCGKPFWIMLRMSASLGLQEPCSIVFLLSP